MKQELPSWALPAGIVAGVVILGGAIWAMMASSPRPVDPDKLPPIESPAPPPPPGG